VSRALHMIGVLGGTFDPIHYGHLRPAQEVMRALGLAQLRLIPAGMPPHRQAPVASAAQRLEMARLACAEFPGFTVDDRELKRGGPSYTVDTLTSLRAELGEQPLCWLVGADAFRNIDTWHAWQRLPALAHVVVIQRPGAESEEAGASPRLAQTAGWLLADAPHDLAHSAAGRLWFQSVTPQDISGTRVRAAIGRGEPVRQWVPAPVEAFIRTHDLYIHSKS